MAENTATYEGMFILDANQLARDRDTLPQVVEGLIQSAGGKMEVSRLWEERRLAYPIKGQRKGAYWITYFRLPTSKVDELTKQCNIQDGILRHLFVRLPDSLVNPILEHAKGTDSVKPASPEALNDAQEDAEEASEPVETAAG